MAISLIQPQGDLMAPAFMAMAAAMIVIIPTVTISIRLVTRTLRAWF
jgi:hypothetical protein